MQKKWLNDCKSQRWWMTSRKQSSRYNKSDTGIHPQWLWHKNKTCIGSKRQSPWDGKWTQSPIDNQENFCNWYLLEKKNSLFSSVMAQWYWACQSHSKAGPTSRNSWTTQNRLCLLYELFVLFCSYCVFSFCLYVLELFVCLLREWRWRGSRRSEWRGKNMVKYIICKKFLMRISYSKVKRY